jgi:monofunctional biosynthetic peptidoglycan transglycosylase
MAKRGILRKLGRGVAAMLGVGFAYAAFVYLTLPDVRPLRTSNPETTAFMELRAREARAKGAEPKKVQRWVPYRRISPNLVRAVLVAEDSGFWKHEGIEFEQMKESIEANLERLEFARGGSTITQQLAKNLYLSPSKNPVRKAREILIARRLEAELTKQRILEVYLNVIEWGDDLYGAEAAARTYFGKSAAELGPQESALLAGAIINPHVHSPAHPTARLRRRQQMILRRMGAVTPPPALAESPAKPPAEVNQGVAGAESAPPAGGPPATLPGEAIAPAPPLPPPCEQPPCGLSD